MRRAAGIAALVLAAGAIAVAVSGAWNGSEARVDRWVPLRSAGLARTEVAAARVGTSIYVVGGFVRAGNATTAAVERYDVSGNRWTRVRSMPLGLNHPAATAYKGDVYVVGGYTADNALAGETAAFLRYDPERNRWSRLPDMPTRRAALAVGVIGDRLYAAGGATSAGTTFKRLEVFDFKTRRWSRGPDMQVPREHVAGAVSGGGFYVLGGRPGNLAVAERYVPARAALGAPARPADGPQRHRRRDRRAPGRGVRRRAQRGDDPSGRGVRPAHAPLARAARDAHAPPRPRRRLPRPPRVLAGRRPTAGLRLLARARGARPALGAVPEHVVRSLALRTAGTEGGAESFGRPDAAVRHGHRLVSPWGRPPRSREPASRGRWPARHRPTA